MSRAQAALEAIKSNPEPFVKPLDVAPVLGVDPHSIRLQAEEEPRALGFNVVRIGNKTLIPRVPFIQFVEGVNA